MTKRIAVFLCGRPRLLDRTWESIQQLFSQDDVEVDFYFHFWLDDSGEHEHPHYKEHTTLINKKKILDLIKPIEYIFETQQEFSNAVNILKSNGISRNGNPVCDYGIMYRLCSQYYSFCQFTEMIDPSRYNYIMKARTDIMFDWSCSHLLDLVTDSEIVFSPYDAFPEDGILPNQHTDQAIGDICWFATSEMFFKMKELYTFLMTPSLYKHNLKGPNTFCSHYVLKYYLDHYKIKYRHLPFCFMLLRPQINGFSLLECLPSFIQYFDKVSKPTMLLRNNPSRRYEILEAIEKYSNKIKVVRESNKIYLKKK